MQSFKKLFASYSISTIVYLGLLIIIKWSPIGGSSIVWIPLCRYKYLLTVGPRGRKTKQIKRKKENRKRNIDTHFLFCDILVDEEQHQFLQTISQS